MVGSCATVVVFEDDDYLQFWKADISSSRGFVVSVFLCVRFNPKTREKGHRERLIEGSVVVFKDNDYLQFGKQI